MIVKKLSDRLTLPFFVAIVQMISCVKCRGFQKVRLTSAVPVILIEINNSDFQFC